MICHDRHRTDQMQTTLVSQFDFQIHTVQVQERQDFFREVVLHASNLILPAWSKTH